MIDAKQLVRTYFAAVNDERWDDIVSLFADDAELFVPSQRPKIGKDAIRRFYEDIGGRFATHTTEVVFLIAEDDQAAATVRYSGTHRDGRPVVTFATDTFVFDRGLIRELRVVFDTADFERGRRSKEAT